MNIAIEAFALSSERITGIGNVVHNYIELLQQLDQKNNYYVYTIDGLKHVKLFNDRWKPVTYSNIIKNTNVKLGVQLKIAKSEKKFSKWFLVILLKVTKMFLELIDSIYYPIWIAYSMHKNRIDVYFGTFADYFPILISPGIKKIWLIHDLVWKIFPQMLQVNSSVVKNIFTKYSMNRCDLLLSVSNNTKNDLMNLLKIKTKIITLFNAANSSQFYPANNAAINLIKKKLSIKGPYILSVCTLEPRKNLESLIKAYAQMKYSSSYKLVLVGMHGWKNSSLFDLLTKTQLDNQVILTGYVPDEYLAPLFSGATMFVYPSVYEGFGLPVLEAMKCGCPVITSNSSSLPEVIGDAGILVDPTNIDDLSAAMVRLITNKKLCATYKRKGLQQSLLFSWEKSCRQLMDIFNSIIIK